LNNALRTDPSLMTAPALMTLHFLRVIVQYVAGMLLLRIYQ